MIKYYCQYSYGGYKTYRIKGEANELLTQIVTTEENQELPELANLYFNRNGIKILYRYLDDNTISLIVKEIPGTNLDTDNRPISCAVQFIGDAGDRGILDRLTIYIANNITQFEKDFANMFDLRGGLHFYGDKLDAIVKQCEKQCDYEGNSSLLDIRKRQGVVLLFVPFSDNFGNDRDKKVTDKTLSELLLPLEASEEERIVRPVMLKRIQGHIKPLFSSKDKSNYDDIETMKDLLHKSEMENSNLRLSAVQATEELKSLKTDYLSWEKNICFLCLFVNLLILVLVLTKCYTATWIGITIIICFSLYKAYKLFKL